MTTGMADVAALAASPARCRRSRRLGRPDAEPDRPPKRAAARFDCRRNDIRSQRFVPLHCPSANGAVGIKFPMRPNAWRLWVTRRGNAKSSTETKRFYLR
jgi:hypothetical protein